MAFTNVYDVTFPPDTQLASQGASDFRGFRVDTQQRMAAISGLDAAKPAFGSDAQPANWNGILFFATDTGKIYQFNNPSWTDVTTNFKTNGQAIFKDGAQHINTGNTTNNTIYSVNIPILVVQSQLRMRLCFLVVNIAASTATVKVLLGGVSLFGGGIPIINGQNYDGGPELIYDITMVNQNNVSSQATFVVPLGFTALSTNLQATAVGSSAVNTGIAQTLIVQCQNGNSSVQINFDNFSVELL